MLFQEFKRKFARKKPISIGKLAIYRNTEENIILPIRIMYLKENTGSLWKEYGNIYFGIRFFWFWYKFKYTVGSKSAIIPRWMIP